MTEANPRSAVRPLRRASSDGLDRRAGYSLFAMRADERAPVARRLPARVTAALRRRLSPESAVVLVMAALVAAVHDVGYLLSQPYWLDEAWVASVARFPLHDLPRLTSATPIGWSAIIAVVPLGSNELGRLVPLAFAGGTVAVAYWFARLLGWRRTDVAVGAGLLAAFAMLLLPALLVRDDLKQYTADAFFALLALATLSRLERAWSRRTLAALSVAVWGGMLFSHPTAFVGIACFLALVVVQLARREWRRLAEAAVAGAATAVLMGAVYKAFDARNVVKSLTDYWRPYYLPLSKGISASSHFITVRLGQLEPYFGLGTIWLALPLVIAGLVTIARLGHAVTALAVALLWPELAAASAVKRYPFLDLRTSTFLIAVTTLVAAVGVAGICALVRPYWRGTLAVALALLAAIPFAVHSAQDVRSHKIPFEDARDQVRYVARNADPHDVIVVNNASNRAFVYYAPFGGAQAAPDSYEAIGYLGYYPDRPRIVMAVTSDYQAVSFALHQAVVLARTSPGARIWLVRSHENRGEIQAWRSALRDEGLVDVPAGHGGLATAVPVG